MVGSEGSGLVGNERALRRAHLTDEFEQAVKRIAFDVEFGPGPVAQHGGELAHVLRAHVPSVGAWMHRDSVSARAQRDARRVDDAWNADAAGIAQQRNLVEIHAQESHAGERLTARADP